MKTNLLIAANLRDARLAQKEFPRFRSYLVVTPCSVPKVIVISEYVWTQEALMLPPSVRLKIRGDLAPAMTEDSVEEVYPAEMLKW